MPVPDALLLRNNCANDKTLIIFDVKLEPASVKQLRRFGTRIVRSYCGLLQHRIKKQRLQASLSLFFFPFSSMFTMHYGGIGIAGVAKKPSVSIDAHA